MRNLKTQTTLYLENLKSTFWNKNFLYTNIFKIVIVLSLLVFNTVFLFTLQTNFFRFDNLAPNDPLFRVLFNTTQQWKDANSTNIISSLLIYLMIIFSLLKNYINVNKNQLFLKKYSPFYLVYLIYSLATIGIYFSLTEITPSFDIWYLILILSCFFSVINIIYRISNAIFSFKKLDPMEIKNHNIGIISHLLRFVLYIFTFYIGYSFLNINSTNPLLNNDFTIALKDLFQTTSPLNTFIISIIVTLIVILFLAVNTSTLFKIFKKDRSILSFKEFFVFMGIIFITLVIWILSKYSLIQDNYTVFPPTTTSQYVFIISSIINILIVISYIIIVRKNIIKREIMKKTLDYNLLFIIWIIIAAVQLSVETNFTILLTNLLTGIIASYVIIARFVNKEKTMLLENQILLILFVLSVLVYGFLSTFQIDLINSGNYVIFRQVLGINIITFTSLIPACISFILAIWKWLSITVYTYNIGLKTKNKNTKLTQNK